LRSASTIGIIGSAYHPRLTATEPSARLCGERQSEHGVVGFAQRFVHAKVETIEVTPSGSSSATAHRFHDKDGLID
jgi:hypothetical protein